MSDSGVNAPARSFGRVNLCVVKLGSAIVAHPDGGVYWAVLDSVARDVAALRTAGTRVVIVSSGAVALGMSELRLGERPDELAKRQALAGVGQGALMRAWREVLGGVGLVCAQVLLSADDLSDWDRYGNAKRALEAMLDLDIVPVLNENDTVATAELKVGDNDALAAQVASSMGADLLVLLSTFDGLYTADPRKHAQAKRISKVDEVNEDIEELARTGISNVGSGGMAGKVRAAHSANRFGINAIVAAGAAPNALLRAVRGEDVGTCFAPAPSSLGRRKHWIGYGLKPKGLLRIDPGAVRALGQGKSLLPSGVLAVEGAFSPRDPVAVVAPGGQTLAQGLCAYSAEDAEKLRGAHSAEIASRLGRSGPDELIHRDDLVVF